MHQQEIEPDSRSFSDTDNLHLTPHLPANLSQSTLPALPLHATDHSIEKFSEIELKYLVPADVLENLPLEMLPHSRLSQHYLPSNVVQLATEIAMTLGDITTPLPEGTAFTRARVRKVVNNEGVSLYLQVKGRVPGQSSAEKIEIGVPLSPALYDKFVEISERSGAGYLEKSRYAVPGALYPEPEGTVVPVTAEVDIVHTAGANKKQISMDYPLCTLDIEVPAPHYLQTLESGSHSFGFLKECVLLNGSNDENRELKKLFSTSRLAKQGPGKQQAKALQKLNRGRESHGSPQFLSDLSTHLIDRKVERGSAVTEAQLNPFMERELKYAIDASTFATLGPHIIGETRLSQYYLPDYLAPLIGSFILNAEGIARPLPGDFSFSNVRVRQALHEDGTKSYYLQAKGRLQDSNKAEKVEFGVEIDEDLFRELREFSKRSGNGCVKKTRYELRGELIDPDLPQGTPIVAEIDVVHAAGPSGTLLSLDYPLITAEVEVSSKRELDLLRSGSHTLSFLQRAYLVTDGDKTIRKAYSTRGLAHDGPTSATAHAVNAINGKLKRAWANDRKYRLLQKHHKRTKMGK